MINLKTFLAKILVDLLMKSKIRVGDNLLDIKNIEVLNDVLIIESKTADIPVIPDSFFEKV